MTNIQSLMDELEKYMIKQKSCLLDERKMLQEEITLIFQGYFDEKDLDIFEGKIGVYCAYAINAEGHLSDLVYIGRSGDNIKKRVEAHQNDDDEARSTLKTGEHLAYAFAETTEHELCEEILIAKHRDYPRLANSKLKKPYEGKAVHLKLSGDCLWLKRDIQYNGPENRAAEK